MIMELLTHKERKSTSNNRIYNSECQYDKKALKFNLAKGLHTG